MSSPPTPPEQPVSDQFRGQFRGQFRAEYARRMNAVLDHIDRHLDTPLDLAQLADVAHFSRFHFHRVFAAWMGETLGDYARRRRLETAALRLACRADEAILDIALATGFGSGEAFARAFKLKFGCTPTAWRAGVGAKNASMLTAMRQRRQDSNPDQAMRNADQENGPNFQHHGYSNPFYRETPMQVTILDLPPASVACQRHIGPYGPAIGAFWRDTVAPWMQSHGLADATCYGVGHDDPSITPPDKCRYDACVALPDGFQAGGRASITTLPGGRYAVAQFKGPSSAIAETWTRMTHEWLPASGLQWDERPCFERFSAATAMDPATGEFSCEICIPVRPL